MGRGRNRKPRNFATFRLCPRPGAADASDRVFVRVDDNPYTVPGFADDNGHSHGVGPPSCCPAGGDDVPSSSSVDDGGDALPDNVRREILELGLPDDGYDYLAHLRELRPSLSSTGGGASAVFLPSRRPARAGLSPDVKAYDLSGVTVGSFEVAETAVTVTRLEEAIDLDVAKQLEESDLPAVGSGDEDLEDDFVVIANHPDEDKDGETSPREQFDSLALDEHPVGEDEQIGESSNAIPYYAGCNVRYSDEHRQEELVVHVPESSAGSAIRCCATTVSRSYRDAQPGKPLAPENVKMKLPRFAPGETSMKKVIINKGIEKLPAEYLPQRRTSTGETLKQKPYKESRNENEET